MADEAAGLAAPLPGARTRPDGIAKVVIPASGSARRRAVGMIVIVLVLLSCTALANIVVDARGQWGSPAGLRPIVDEPVRRKLSLLEEGRVPQTMFIGASRIAAFDPDSWGQEPGFNFAISGGTGLDVAILLEYVLRTQPEATTVVVNLDAFSLTEGRQSRVATSPVRGVILADDQSAPVLPRIRDALSVGLTRDTLSSLQRAFISGYPELRWVYDADGLRHEPRIERLREVGAFDPAAAIVKQYSGENLPFYAGQSDPLDMELAERLVRAVTLALASGREVHVVFPPYAPLAWDLLQNGGYDPTQPVGTMVEKFRPLCGAGLHMHDLTNPALLDLEDIDFDDGHHLSIAGANVVIAAMRAGDLDLCAATPSP